jgi:hypothetical protein
VFYFYLVFLLFPYFLVLGYIFRVVKSSLFGVEELPTFEAWGEMMVRVSSYF